MTLPIDFDFCRDETMRCKGKEGTDMADQEGEYFGNFYVKDTKWALVLWDFEKDPSLYKADMLRVENKRWIPI